LDGDLMRGPVPPRSGEALAAIFSGSLGDSLSGSQRTLDKNGTELSICFDQPA